MVGRMEGKNTAAARSGPDRKQLEKNQTVQPAQVNSLPGMHLRICRRKSETVLKM